MGAGAALRGFPPGHALRASQTGWACVEAAFAVSDFESLSLSPELRAVVQALGYETPTPIQTQSIPLLLAGKDLIGQSKTGSGKTAAFALPILQGLALQPRLLQALIVCPTRELAAQVAREFRKLGRSHKDLQVLVVAGGEPVWPQQKALQRGVHIVVGTPGRLLDHLKRGGLDPQAVKTVVLDEADRMLDMGFQQDMETILSALPETRQTVFFSATFPESIEAMSRAHQKDAARVTVEDHEEARPTIRQVSITAEPEDKLLALYRVFHEFPVESALIFCNMKATVAQLGQDLATDGMSVASLHGDLDQFERDQVLARFRNQSVRILIATDVAGRGIDVEDLDLVVNYELPQQAENYVHRIGRTGRAGREGLAVSLTTRADRRRREEIQQLTGEPIVALPEPGPDAPDRDTLVREISRPAKMDTILISGGRKDKVRPGDVVGALTGVDAGLDAADIGQIELHDRLCYVAVERSVSQRAVRCLNQGRIKGKRFRASFANISGF